MGLGFLLCCLRGTRKTTTSSQDLAVSSSTRHHRSQPHAYQISSVEALPALTSSSDQEPRRGDSSPGRLPSQSHEPQGQEQDLPPQATQPPAEPINCPSSMSRFSFSELEQATDSFNEGRVRGSGGFGKVFEGQLNDGTKIAVKRRAPKSEQGRKEFVTEIELCSGLRHPNVLRLLGFCDERGEMILVYEYMGQGTLAGRLYGSRRDPCLTWEQRLKILIGAGRGLNYLHTCTERGIIHRDVKGPNILLGDNLVAKVADYGLSKVGPELDRTHVTTDAKGTRGYMDPEYCYNSKHVTPQSDVYAFGVVCLEALCARKACNERLPWQEVGLAPLAERKLEEEGHLRGIADERISHTIGANSLKKFTKIVKKCLAEKRKNRPSMEHVITELTIALQLETGRPMWVLEDDDGDSSSGPCSPPCPSDSNDERSDSSDERRANGPGSLWRARPAPPPRRLSEEE